MIKSDFGPFKQASDAVAAKEGIKPAAATSRRHNNFDGESIEAPSEVSSPNNFQAEKLHPSPKE